MSRGVRTRHANDPVHGSANLLGRTRHDVSLCRLTVQPDPPPSIAAFAPAEPNVDRALSSHAMDRRKIETFLAWFTLALLVVYFPAETWASSPRALSNPFYLVDLIAMALLLWGAVRSLRARPRPAPGVLCAGCAWVAANGWRATFWRVREVSQGSELEHGLGELWAVGAATGVSLIGLAVALHLVVRAERHSS